MAHTNLQTIVEELAEQITSVVPRYQPGAERSKFTRAKDQEIRGAARTFDILPSLPTETPGGAYGDGVQYHAGITIRVAYDDLTDNQAVLMAGADLEDLTALLVRLHHAIPGMFPIETEASRTEPALIPMFSSDSEEGRRVVDFVAVVHYLASDTVTLEPAP